MSTATFPEGEDFFIRSVRNYRKQVTDPELQASIKGFIAQEATDRQQHRMLNNRLQAMGYPTARIDRHIKKFFVLFEKMFSEKMLCGFHIGHGALHGDFRRDHSHE